VNKGDRDGAQAAVRDLEQMLRLGAARPWTPPIVLTSATEGDGVDELWNVVEAHRGHLRDTGRLTLGRRERLLREVESLTVEELRARVRGSLDRDEALAGDLADRRIDPYRAAARLADLAVAPEPEADG
jgi:LAO/AO transport system kinase